MTSPSQRSALSGADGATTESNQETARESTPLMAAPVKRAFSAPVTIAQNDSAIGNAAAIATEHNASGRGASTHSDSRNCGAAAQTESAALLSQETQVTL